MSPVGRISVVCPAYEEELVLPRFHAELAAVLDALRPDYDAEVVYVDDGSLDGTLAAAHGLPADGLDVQIVAANRASFTIGPITNEIIETQQAVADRFHRLGLIPRQIAVRDIVWQAAQS